MVLRVVDVFHPVNDLTVERFRNRDVRHRCGRRRAVPVFFAWREPDDITRSDLLDRPALTLRKAGINVDLQAMDFSTLTTRRTKKEPIAQGGWNIFHTWSGGISMSNPIILAAASWELLTTTLANMPESHRGRRVRRLSETLAADVAKKRERLEQKILGRLDALRQAPPEDSA